MCNVCYNCAHRYHVYVYSSYVYKLVWGVLMVCTYHTHMLITWNRGHYFGNDTVTDLRFSIYVFIWLMALLTKLLFLASIYVKQSLLFNGICHVYYKKNIYYTCLFVICILSSVTPASILYKSIAGRHRPVSYPDGPMTARYRFIKNAYWDIVKQSRRFKVFTGN